MFIYLLFHILYFKFAFTLREVCLHSHSESGHRPPDHKVTNYVISKICDVTQSEFARVPPRAPEPLNTGTLGTRLFQGSFGLVVRGSTRPSIFSLASGLCPSSAPPPNHLVPVFSCEKALNIKKI